MNTSIFILVVFSLFHVAVMNAIAPGEPNPNGPIIPLGDLDAVLQQLFQLLQKLPQLSINPVARPLPTLLPQNPGSAAKYVFDTVHNTTRVKRQTSPKKVIVFY